jgi:beta-mannanase
MSVPYGRYEEAYRAIHSALSDLMAPPPGRKLTKLVFTWNPNGALETLKAYDGDELLFTLIFTWNVDGTLKEVIRS